MGGRGTYAIGNDVGYTYKTIGKIDGVKILQPNNINRSLKLPEESHNSSSYVLLDKNGVFHQMRFYNSKHEAIFEIGYHNEASLGQGKILHVHIYSKPGEISHGMAEKFVIGPGNVYYEKYKKYFKGVNDER